MKSFISFRNKIIAFWYRVLLKPVFFKNDPEIVHDRMIGVGKFLGKFWLFRYITKLKLGYQNKKLRQNILGIDFKNPIGLSAGFDKNVEITDILPSVGFGFAEVGSVTAKKCEGNPKPRLWRLKDSKSLVVYYGLKNDGSEAISERLKKKKFRIPIGISVAMTNCEENLEIKNAIKDYYLAFKRLEKFASYITVNISCPNTLSDQPFIKPQNLDRLFKQLDKIKTAKPVFVKLSPDMQEIEIDKILKILSQHRVDGIICANLTKKRDNPKIIDSEVPSKGGISGKVVQESSDKLLSYVYKKAGDRFVLMGVGGVSSAEDAYRKIKMGASLIQMITGMVFEGPQIISQINVDLVRLLEKDGYKNISEAIGVDSEIF